MNRDNFFKATKANWSFKKEMTGKAIEKFMKEADFISESRSSYKYTRKGVYRVSNHFTHHVATCDWTLDGQEHEYIVVMGYCSWKDFKNIA